MGGESSESLLKRLRNNDKQLIAELTHLAQVVAGRMKLPGDVLPADIAQDVWVALLKTLESGAFRGEASIRTFVYATAVKTCLHRARNLKRVSDTDPDQIADPSPDPDNNILESEKWRIAARVLKKLPKTCQTLWELLFVDGLDYRQAADRLNVKEVTVRERMHSCCRQAGKLARQYEQATKRR